MTSLNITKVGFILLTTNLSKIKVLLHQEQKFLKSSLKKKVSIHPSYYLISYSLQAQATLNSIFYDVIKLEAQKSCIKYKNIDQFLHYQFQKMGACETREKRNAHHQKHKDKKKKKNHNQKLQHEPYFNQINQNQYGLTPQHKGEKSHKNTMRPDVDNHTDPGQDSQKSDFQSEKFTFPQETKSNAQEKSMDPNNQRNKCHSMCLGENQNQASIEEAYSLSKSNQEKKSEMNCAKKPLSVVEEQNSPCVHPPQAQQYMNSYFHVNDLGTSTNPKVQDQKSRVKNQDEMKKSQVQNSKVGPEASRYGNQTIEKSKVAYPSLPYLEGYSNIKGTYAI